MDEGSPSQMGVMSALELGLRIVLLGVEECAQSEKLTEVSMVLRKVMPAHKEDDGQVMRVRLSTRAGIVHRLKIAHCR